MKETVKDIKWFKEQFKRLGETPIKGGEYASGATETYDRIAYLLGQVEEPKNKETKPIVVEQFVADWFEENKNNLEVALYKLTLACNDNVDSDITNWYNFTPNNATETLIIMQDKFGGYTVKPEMTLQVKRNGKTILDEDITQSNFDSIYDMLVYEKGEN